LWSAKLGRLLLELLQQGWKESCQLLLNIYRRIDLSLGGKMINGTWQVFRQTFRNLTGIDSEFRTERLDLIGSEDLLNLLARDRRIGSRFNPAREHISQASLGELVHQTL